MSMYDTCMHICETLVVFPSYLFVRAPFVQTLKEVGRGRAFGNGRGGLGSIHAVSYDLRLHLVVFSILKSRVARFLPHALLFCYRGYRVGLFTPDPRMFIVLELERNVHGFGRKRVVRKQAEDRNGCKKDQQSGGGGCLSAKHQKNTLRPNSYK